jgi:FAD-linked oxidoreductase
MQTLHNWAKNLSFQAQSLTAPSDFSHLKQWVRERGEQREKVRVVGAMHSFSPLVVNNQHLLSLRHLRGLSDVDHNHNQVDVWAGTTIAELNHALERYGLALENMGDIDSQSLAGAICTGTHGTGISLQSLANQVTELSLLNSKGEHLTCSLTQYPDIFRAAQVSLGCLGVLTRFRWQAQPAYNLLAKRTTVALETCLDTLAQRIQAHRHFEFFWFPYSDNVQCKTLDITTNSSNLSIQHLWKDWLLENGGLWFLSEACTLFPQRTAEFTKWSSHFATEEQRIGKSYQVFPTPRHVRFMEMEYAIPIDQGVDCLRELRAYFRSHSEPTSFPLEYRTVAADEIWLSPFYHQASAVIAIHAYPRMPWHQLFSDCEAIFRNHSGRPHWGKWHTCSHRYLETVYPKWKDFLKVRKQLDPDGIFLNDYLHHLLGIA